MVGCLSIEKKGGQLVPGSCFDAMNPHSSPQGIRRNAAPGVRSPQALASHRVPRIACIRSHSPDLLLPAARVPPQPSMLLTCLLLALSTISGGEVAKATSHPHLVSYQNST